MKRREFLALPALAALRPAPLAAAAGSITDVEGVKVGHATRTDRPTGCTVLLVEGGATAGVDQRGGAPGTRETDLLRPENMVEKINAIVLSGGSAYGLATAEGVMRYCEEKSFGYDIGRGRVVPIVPAAVLIDLNYGGDYKIRPTAENGYQAAKAASTAAPEQGSVGAGAGATVGKLGDRARSMKGGFGTASVKLPNGVVVGAMVATNCLGDIWDPFSGKLIAGMRTADGKHLADAMKLMREGKLPIEQATRAENTAIGVVATNLALTKAQCTKVSQMASDGYGMAIRPAHTPFDGDTIFAVSTGRLKLPAAQMDVMLAVVGALAADTMARAVVESVLHAKGTPDCPAASDMRE